MSTSRFSGSDGPALGVELELQLVDARTSALRGAIHEILEAIPAGLKDSVRTEFLPCYVAVKTGLCRTVGEVEAELTRTIRAVAEAARHYGVKLGWGGTHPFSDGQDQPVTPNARHHGRGGLLNPAVRRPATFGLHVHVGVDSGDAAVTVVNRIQEYLPALLALSCNSPFWCGLATGHHAHRIELLEAFPTGGMPPLLRDWDDFDALVSRMKKCGFIKDENELWWDVRPNRHHGTVEVGVCDVPADLPAAVGLTALIQCLVNDLARGDLSPCDGPDACFPLLVRQNRWRAARFGLGAALVDHRSGRTTPAWQVLQGLADRLEPTANRLGCLEELGLVRSLAGSPSGAERQLAVYQQTGDLADVVRLQTGERHGAARAHEVSRKP